MRGHEREHFQMLCLNYCGHDFMFEKVICRHIGNMLTNKKLLLTINRQNCFYRGKIIIHISFNFIFIIYHWFVASIFVLITFLFKNKVHENIKGQNN